MAPFVLTPNLYPWEDVGKKHPLMSDLPPGSAEWLEDDDAVAVSLAFACPCGCKNIRVLPVYLGDVGYGWRWVGGREKPTLTPSIQIEDVCRWHGYLTAGEFVPAN